MVTIRSGRHVEISFDELITRAGLRKNFVILDR